MERGYNPDLDLLCHEIRGCGECYPRARGTYIQRLVEEGVLSRDARATLTVDGQRLDIIDNEGNLLGIVNRRNVDYVIKKLRSSMPRANIEGHRMPDNAKPVGIRISEGLRNNL